MVQRPSPLTCAEPSAAALNLPADLFAAQFPFHLVFARDLSIVSAGKALRRLIEASAPDSRVCDLFRIDTPLLCGWTFDELAAHSQSAFAIEGLHCPLRLKGSMNYLPDQDRFLLLASPWIASPGELERQQLRWSDFPIHDPTPDCLFLMQIQDTSLADLQRLSAEVRRHAGRIVEANAQLEAANRALIAESQNREHAEMRFQRYVAAARDVIAIVQGDGTVSSLNGYYEELTGFPASARIGHPIETLVWPDDISAAHRIFNGLSEGKPSASFELRLATDSGGYVSTEFTATELLETGMDRARLFVGRDITARNEVSRLKDNLLSTVSHELRTPLTSMRGFLELLEERTFSKEKFHEILAILRYETSRLENLVTDFLDVKKIEAKGLELHLDPVDLLAVIRRQILLFRGASGTRVIVDQLPAALPPVLADAGAVSRIVSNLLSNAIKFSAGDQPIEVAAVVTREHVQVSVIDHGIGIPEDSLHKIFEPFWRMNNSATRNAGGTGLGLALVRQLVEGQNGVIWVDSRLGAGSTFHFALPLAAD